MRKTNKKVSVPIDNTIVIKAKKKSKSSVNINNNDNIPTPEKYNPNSKFLMQSWFIGLYLIILVGIIVLSKKSSIQTRHSILGYDKKDVAIFVQKKTLPIIPLPNNFSIFNATSIKINRHSQILVTQPNFNLNFVSTLLRNALINIFDDSIKHVEYKKQAVPNLLFIPPPIKFKYQNIIQTYTYQKPIPCYNIELKLNDSLKNEEYYIHTNATKLSIIIEGSKSGLIYGAVSLIQMIYNNNDKQDNESIMPRFAIHDKPVYEYRGMHLDVVRHFFPISLIKTYIDILFYYKFNKFHWHLTDDQGWRIEIKKYPSLTKIGAYRNGTIIGRDRLHKKPLLDNIVHGGYYTQAEITEIVNYAKERNIEVIPEIEMPGHSNALLASLPQLGCNQKGYSVSTRWRQNQNIICVGREENFDILFNILSEVINLFPSKYIHLGGDESNLHTWNKCKFCSAKMKALHTDVKGLYFYTFKRLNKFVNTHDKQLIIWDDELSHQLDTNITIINWKQNEFKEFSEKFKIILNNQDYFYLNYYQDKSFKSQPLAFKGLTTLKHIYFYKMPANTFLGIQSNIWTEYIKTPNELFYMMLPRSLAVAELGWTETASLNYQSFLSRLLVETRRFDASNLNYYKQFLDN